MRRHRSNLSTSRRARLRRLASGRSLFLLGASAIIVSLFVLRGLEKGDPRNGRTRLSAKPSDAFSRSVTSSLKPDAIDFEQGLVGMIRQQGRITVTVHVALLDRPGAGGRRPFGDGNDPTTNLYWGALYGMEVHFANAAGWRRAYTDNGNGRRIVRRVVFHRRVTPSPAWELRGVTDPFDVYVLANAWPSSRIVEAMEQPIRDAVCGEPVMLQVDDRRIGFGGASVVVGYVGQNHMLKEYWDPFAQLEHCRSSRQVGVFYLCPRSAVVLHTPVVERGLYSVLFMRSSATPEAYLTDGMLRALLTGELGDGFMTEAAAEYARYQKGVSFKRASGMLIR